MDNPKGRRDCPKCGYTMGYAHPSAVHDDPALEDQIWRFQVCRNKACANYQTVAKLFVFDVVTGVKYTFLYEFGFVFFMVDGKSYQFFTTWAKSVIAQEG